MGALDVVLDEAYNDYLHAAVKAMSSGVAA
jgi:hypothetical protein